MSSRFGVICIRARIRRVLLLCANGSQVAGANIAVAEDRGQSVLQHRQIIYCMSQLDQAVARCLSRGFHRYTTSSPRPHHRSTRLTRWRGGGIGASRRLPSGRDRQPIRDTSQLGSGASDHAAPDSVLRVVEANPPRCRFGCPTGKPDKILAGRKMSAQSFLKSQKPQAIAGDALCP